jgi:hypothetical protein
MRRKILLFIAVALILPFALEAQNSAKPKKAPPKREMIVYEHAYIWGHYTRNNSLKGSAIDLKSGKTYCLASVLGEANPAHIDMLCYWGMVGKAKNNNFYLFAPGNKQVIDWSPTSGTIPYCAMVANARNEFGSKASLRYWKVRNATRMQLKSNKKAHFDTATLETLDSLSITADFYILPVKVGDIILFETVSNAYQVKKKGLMKIVSVEDDPDRLDQKGKGWNQKLNVIIKIEK